MLASRSSTTRKPSLDVEIPILNATSAGTTTGAGAGAGGAGSGDDDALCRICSGEADPGHPLVSPCSCRGSMSGVHEACLQRWIETRPHRDSLRCELCNEPYQVSFKKKFVCDCQHTCSCAACGHLSEFIILVFCLVCIISLVFLLKPEFEQSTTSERVFLLVTFGLTVIFSLFVLVKVFHRWRDASSRQTLVANERLSPRPESRTLTARAMRMLSGAANGSSNASDPGGAYSAAPGGPTGQQRGGSGTDSDTDNGGRLPTSFAVTVIANMV